MNKTLRFALLFAAIWGPVLALAQPVLGLCVPDMSHASHRPVIDRLQPMGWGMATLALEMPGSPGQTLSLTALESFVREQLRAGRRVTLRLPGGVWPSKGWTAAAGTSYDTPFVPPSAVWDEVAAYDRQWVAAARRACAAVGAPLSAVTFELGVERGIGGVGGPQRGSWSTLSPIYDEFKVLWRGYLQTAREDVWADAKAKWLEVFPAWTWDGGPMPEGHIPSRSTDFVRYRRFNTSFSGFPVISMTFELSNEATARAELQSFLASESGKRLLGACSHLGMNVYADDARRYWDPVKKLYRIATYAEAADRWAAKIEKRAFWVRQYAELQGERLSVVESNVRDDRVPSEPHLYRLAMIQRAKSLSVVDAVGTFCSVATDNASLRNNLYAWSSGVLSPVGGEVGPFTKMPPVEGVE